MTTPNFDPAAVQAFLESVSHPVRRADGLRLLELMRAISGEEPALWGPTMVGFGVYHYKYESGREGDSLKIGFAPRREAMVIYGLLWPEGNTEPLSRLGSHTTGKSCLYIKRLNDVDEAVLIEMIAAGWTNDSQPTA